MFRRRSRKRVGTTLIEVLVSVGFLAVVASAILVGVTQANRRIGYAERRKAALLATESQIAQVRAVAKTTALTPGTTNTQITLPPSESATVTRTITTMPGYPTLYSLIVSTSWFEGSNPDSIVLNTTVRAPND